VVLTVVRVFENYTAILACPFSLSSLTRMSTISYVEKDGKRPCRCDPCDTEPRMGGAPLTLILVRNCTEKKHVVKVEVIEGWVRHLEGLEYCYCPL
jgi:hypothetical protein